MSKHFNRESSVGLFSSIRQVAIILSVCSLISCVSAQRNLEESSSVDAEKIEIEKLGEASKPLKDLQVNLSSFETNRGEANRGEANPGEVIPGSIVFVTVQAPEVISVDHLSGTFENIHLPFFPLESESTGGMSTYATVLGIPYEQKLGATSLTVTLKQANGPLHKEVAFRVVDGHYPSEVLHVDGRRVNPKKQADLSRIRKEQKEIGEVYRQVTQQKYWHGPFVYPIHSKVTSPFGIRRVYNGELKSFHSGLDLRAAIGTPVYSAAPGKVVMAKNLFYTGNTVFLDHGYGVITFYAHLDRLSVKPGDEVKVKQLVGLSGKTGRVNGPHLHWQAVIHGVKVNPIGLTEVVN